MNDIFGTEVSLETTAARDSWNKMQMAFLAHSAATPNHLADVLEREPGFAAAHAVKGLFYMMLGKRELIEVAIEANKTAQSCPKSPLKRERSFVRALNLWLAGHMIQARDEVETILIATPTDSLAMKISHAMSFIMGDRQMMRRSLESVLPSYDPTHKASGYIKGCYAFALEETGDYTRAEEIGREGVLQAPDDAWGLHAVAHVYDMTAQTTKGLDWLTGREKSWAHCNNFRYHVWWHKALMLLESGHIDQVMDLYDTEIRADKTDDYRDISNATALLSRLELYGHNVGNRWEELAAFSENRTEDGCLIFADLHYMLALMGGNRKDAIRKIMARMQRDAARNGSDSDRVMASPGLSAMSGLEAFSEADFTGAFANLSAARSQMQLAGGSHAQRDIFERITIDAGIRSGAFAQAEAILKDRQTNRGGAEDNFASVRFQMISDARGDAQKQPAE
ncbi:tetratricopeptide repeat protein [Halocynthiibacter namhaensis]|uniref:tetratricopeptide repeat protein n=1 Tax=Halocynthiibacter namhaensis TaxID=1290553 RepID=UPI000579986E|nr:tetratricopeptide repeat protein [Halocynthiibacter namhaensis]